MDIPFIWTHLRKLRRNYGEEKRMLVIIDYLQLISGDMRLKGNRQAEISEISRALKQMAKELNVVVIALSQLSRAVESRQDKRPMLSDLRESGQIEQDADLIAFLYRDDYYDKQSEQANKIEVILAKQRNGPVGTIHLLFRPLG
jgi:replicative DNA helicase